LRIDLERRRTLQQDPGVIHLDAGGNLVQSSVKAPRNANWKNLPKPARELIDLAPYREAWVSAHGYFSTSVVASRGCPYRCNWCAKPISGNKFQLRAPELVAAEIRELKKCMECSISGLGMTSLRSTSTGSNNSPTRLKRASAVAVQDSIPRRPYEPGDSREP
jgi:tRNA A37 methylthiotransferase MiaB